MIVQQAIAKGIKTIANSQKSPKWQGYINVVEPDYFNVDPYIFLVHHRHKFRPGERSGFPAHPHRGFETVTYVLEGGFDHGDSKGNKGRYGANDIQYMSAGKGVLHSEMFVTDKDQPTSFDGFQLWLNLPAKLKMSEPNYKMVWGSKGELPIVKLPSHYTPGMEIKTDGIEVKEEDQTTVKIIFGSVNGVESKVKKTVPLSYLHVKMAKGKSFFSHPSPKEHNAFIYVMKGQGEFGLERKLVKPEQYVIFEKNGDVINVWNTSQGHEPLEFLLLEGQPFNEPFAHQGPFVMNTKQELARAFQDYYNGKFGTLKDDYPEDDDD